MKLEEVMSKLEELGLEQTKKIYMNHGVKEPFYGFKVGDLKKLVKYVKRTINLHWHFMIRGIMMRCT